MLPCVVGGWQFGFMLVLAVAHVGGFIPAANGRCIFSLA